PTAARGGQGGPGWTGAPGHFDRWAAALPRPDPSIDRGAGGGGPAMKPPPFEYYRATTVEEAIALLSQYGPDAKILAGGQSLLPMIKFRLATPSLLVRCRRVP